MWNFKNLALGAFFAVCAIICLVAMINGRAEAYHITGLIVFSGVAIAALKRARK